MRFEHWKNEEKVVSQRIDRKEMRFQNAQNEIYQLLGIYFVFQGVILTAIAQAANLPRNRLWIPLSLSVLASISTILALWYKLEDCSDLEVSIEKEKDLSWALYEAADNLRSMNGEVFNPEDYKFQPRLRHAEGKNENTTLLWRLWVRHMRWYGALLILILFIVSSIMAASCCLVYSSETHPQV